MLNNIANIKKLFYLGFAVASTKVMLLLFAYFFDSTTYNYFNQIYYTASIVILFGSLGFNIAITRINVRKWLVALTVFITTSFTFLILQIFSLPFKDIFEIISILIYCIFISLSGIYVFQLLFSGKYREYVLLTLIYSVLHLLIIPSILFFQIGLIEVLPIVAFLWFLISWKKYLKQDLSESGSLKEFYKIGISAFVINSAVSLALAADKYFVNHFFTIDIANAYTFAWGLTAPMFYIGVLIEQYLFSESNPSKTNILRKGFTLVTLLVVLYALIVISAIYFFPVIVPDSVDYFIVLKIFSLMISGYSLYVIIHFPVNAYLFKSLGTKKQKTISISFSIIILFFISLYSLMLQGILVIDYVQLLLITWSYIFILLMAKVFIMFRNNSEVDTHENILEIKNIEP